MQRNTYREVYNPRLLKRSLTRTPGFYDRLVTILWHFMYKDSTEPKDVV